MKKKRGFPDTSKMKKEIFGKHTSDNRTISFLSGNRWECECGRIGIGDFSSHVCSSSGSHPVERCFCQICESVKQQTTSDSVIVELTDRIDNYKLPIDGEDYGDNKSTSFFRESRPTHKDWWDTFCRWLESPSPF